ncbi:MAG: cell division topological specificity factor MinE [Clostridia bacterium]|nr:cell division topological specificity factor MinE [Clostridia bacterium]
MLEFISKILGKDNVSSKNIAKDRLRLVLVHDRSDISPQVMQDLRKDLIEVISNYMEIDEKSLEVNFDHVENQVALVANIPVKRMK